MAPEPVSVSFYVSLPYVSSAVNILTLTMFWRQGCVVVENTKEKVDSGAKGQLNDKFHCL